VLREKIIFTVITSILILGTVSFTQVFAVTEDVKILASDAAPGDFFGHSTSISGDTAIVGAYLSDDTGPDSGSAYVFVKSGNTWTEQAKLTASDAAAGDGFGLAVSISGDTAIVGAFLNDDAGFASGSAYVFVRSGNTWTEQAKITASDAAPGDIFGHSATISGDMAIVGAQFDNDSGPNSGSVYVFVRSGNTWTEQAKLTASDAAAGDRLGHSVSISGDMVMVGAHANDDAGTDSGSAYVFVRSGNTWTEQAKLTASDAAAGDNFGHTASISGDTAIVSAYLSDDAGIDSGSAYVFVRSGNTWTEQAKLTASDAAPGDIFGHKVSISGNTALVGSERNDDAGTDSGSAYVFVRSGTAWKQAKLTASDAAVSDTFAHWVSISGNTAMVGAHANDDAGTDSGSAYVYFLVDTDNDGILDVIDNCPNTTNTGQEDIDVDGIGDVCDTLHLITADTQVVGSFTILTGQTLQVESGAVFSIPDGNIVNNNSDLTINNFGTMKIFGILNNAGSFNNHPGAVLNNSATGTINNNVGGTITNMAGALILNDDGATLNNNSGDTISNYGVIINQKGSIINNNGLGKIINNDGGFIRNTASSINNNAGGQIVAATNSVIVNQDSGTITNIVGTININGGILLNKDTGIITNNVGGTLNNIGGIILNRAASSINNAGGTISNNGVIYTVGVGANMVNTGLFTINANGILVNDVTSTISNNPGGTITNDVDGLVVNKAGGTINNNSGNTINNNGKWFNLDNTTFNNNFGAVLNNSGEWFNIDNTTFNNNLGADLNNNSGGVLANFGTQSNAGSVTNANGAIYYNGDGGNLTNLPGGLITNNLGGLGFNDEFATLNNNVGATIDNSLGGDWFNECGGIVNNQGTILGGIIDLSCI